MEIAIATFERKFGFTSVLPPDRFPILLTVYYQRFADPYAALNFREGEATIFLGSFVSVV